MRKIIIYLKNFDWILFAGVFLLLCLSLAEIYSIALGNDSLDLLNFKKQFLFVGAGLFVLFFFSFLDYHFLRNFSFHIYLIGIVALVAVLFFGQTVRNTTGWFDIAGFGVQPVEFVKIILIIFLAGVFSSKTLRSRPLRHLIKSAVFAFLPVLLVILQPDFGSAMILLAVWGVMIFFAGFDKKYFLLIGALLFVFFALAWLFLFKDYQKNRILTFINPSQSSLSAGYNVSQAIIAVGSGGMMGRGIGAGSQSQLKFLPEAQNDFIFAVIAEELGFFGVLFVFVFFFLIFWRGLSSIGKINNDFGIFFILGALGLIFIEIFINIGMNIGIIPVIGISLPFLSYGGSAVISKLIIIGIMENIIIKSKINY